MFLLLVFVTAFAIAQVTVTQSSKTIVVQRWLSDVHIAVAEDGTATFRGTITRRTLDGSDIVKAETLRTIKLTGTPLATALSNAGLPTEGQIVNRFRNLFHAAYTNELVAAGQSP